MRKEGKGRFLSILLALILLVSIAHVTLHVVVYQTSIPLAKTIGISGQAIGNIEITDNFEQEIKESYPSILPISQIVLIGEWALLLTVSLFMVIRTRVKIKKDAITRRQVKRTDKSKTDIDLLYDLLKDKKKIGLSSISKAFDIDKETAREWAEILENGNLATINYPRLGEPEVTFNEVANEKEKKQQ